MMDPLYKSSSDCNVSFTIRQRNDLLIAMASSGVVSSVMCSIAVLLVLYLTMYKYFVYRLALYQVLSSLFFSLSEVIVLLMINYTPDNKYYIIACRTTAFLVQYTMSVKLLFTLCLMFHLFSLAVCLKNLKNFEIAYILVSIVFPLFVDWIPFVHDFYDLAGPWCWIRDWNNDCPSQKDMIGIIEQFSLWYGPLFISLTLCLIVVIIILSVLVKRAYVTRSKESEPLLVQENRNKIALKEILPLLAYPIIFFVLALFPLIDRIYGAISPHGSFNLLLIHALSEASWGSFSALALLVHVCLRHKLRHQTSNQPAYVQVDIECNTAVYTSSAIASTNALSEYLMPRESEAEND